MTLSSTRTLIAVALPLLVLGLLSASSVRAQDATLSIETRGAASGENVDVPIEVTGFDDVGSVGLTITFDPDNLSFPSNPSTPDLIEGAPREGFSANVPEPGVLRISWFDNSGDTPLTLGTGTLLTITFDSFSGESEVAFDQENSEILSADGQTLTPTFWDGRVTDDLRTLSVGTRSDVALGDTVEVSLTGEAFTNAGSASLDLAFDPAVLQFAGLTDNSNLGLEADTQEGRLRIGGFNADGDTLEGSVGNLQFLFLGGVTPLRVRGSSDVTDTTGTSLPVRFDDGEIAGNIPVVRFPERALAASETTSVSLETANLRKVGSASVLVTFESTDLTFLGVENAPDDFNLEVNKTDPGQVKIAGFSADGIDPGGALVDLRFALDRDLGDDGVGLRIGGAASKLTSPEGATYNVRFQNGKLTETTLIPPTDLTAQQTGTEIELNWVVPSGLTAQEFRVYRDTSPIETSPSGANRIATVEGSETTYTDTEATAGETYYYRVTTVDSSGSESEFSGEASALLYPQELTANVTRTFDDAAGVGDYRLVALPGAVDRSLRETISGASGTEWQAWWDDGSDNDFLVRFDSSSTFDFRAGRGFWLASTSDWSVDVSVSTVDLRGGATKIPLNDGWTIISNPFDVAVDWSAVEAANGGDLQGLWPFEGSFNDTTTTFASATTGRAYYLFNDNSSRDSLVIPYPDAPSNKARDQTSGTQASLLALSARRKEAEGPASTVRMGRGGDGKETSLVAPPGRFEPVSLRIQPASDQSSSAAPAGESGKRDRLLMATRRTDSGAGTTFRLRLTNQSEEPVHLSASNWAAVDGKAVALIDPATGQSYDLRTDGPVTLDKEGKSSRFLKVAIGTDGYVKSQKDQVLPEEVNLTAYPNPVRQQGTLEYALPEASDVTLRVYDVLGRQVATLDQGRKEAGRHTARFEADGLASGVYFGRLQAGGQTLTQKITIVR